MPRYFFDVHDGYSSTDTDGTELPDWQTARREAVRLAGQILTDEADKLLLGEEWRMEVTDATGLTMFKLDICFTEASVAQEPMRVN